MQILIVIVSKLAHSYLYSFIHPYIKSNSNSTINSAVKPSLDYSTTSSLHCFATQPLYKCRVSHRSAAVDGRKAMCYKTMQKHDKIKYNLIVCSSCATMFSRQVIGPLNLTVQWPLVSHLSFLFVWDKKNPFYLLHTIQF